MFQNKPHWALVALIYCLLLSVATPSIRAQFNILGAINGTTDTVTLTVTGTLSGTFFSSAGNYAITAVPNGTYTIVPSLAGFTFSPASRTVTVAGANVLNADFIAITTGSLSPIITAFSPATGSTGSLITINGVNLNGATEVRFGDVTAASFTVSSSTQITAIVSTGATGNVQVTTGFGTALLGGFTFTTATVPISGNNPPTISTIANQTAIVGSSSAVISFTLADSETPVNALTVFGFSSNQSVLRNSAIVFSGSGATRGVQLTPENAGTTQVTIGVYDGLLTATTTFLLTANAPNAPVITSFSPTTVSSSMPITIIGRHFTGATSVTFGGDPAANFTVVNDTLIIAVVASGSSGNVAVVTPGGTASASGFTFVRPGPLIAGFTPTRATTGSVVTIFGQNFSNVVGVSFGGIPAAQYTVLSTTQIVAVVSTGATGQVRVTTNFGTAVLAGFTFVPPPVVAGFAPTNGGVGTQVNIFGFGFTTTRQVFFGGVPAQSFQILSDSQITAVVGAGTTGDVLVQTEGGGAALGTFLFIAGPQSLLISGFAPMAQFADSAITIFGVGFTGTTAITIGGARVSDFRVISDTQILAFVPRSAQSGSVVVTTPLGTTQLGGFVLRTQTTQPSAPTISPIADQVMTANTTLTLPFSVGSNAVPAEVLQVIASSTNALLLPNSGLTLSGSGTNRTLTIQPLAGQTGRTTITLIASDGQRSSTISFNLTVVAPAGPSIVNFTPTAAGTGEMVTINGNGLRGATSVTFGGVAAQIVSVDDVRIQALVGAGASGEVRVITPSGSAALPGFTFVPPPIIVSFSPTVVVTSGTVLISGRGFSGATSVSFGGTQALFTVLSDERISAQVTSGSTGEVRVVTPRGTASLGGFTFIPAGRNFPPSISPIPNQSIPFSRVVGPIPFVIEDANVPASGLSVFATSSNPQLLPNQAIVIQGQGMNRTITLFPAAGQTGSAIITVVVFNGVLTTTTQFVLSVSTVAVMPRAVSGVMQVFPNPMMSDLTASLMLDEPSILTVRLSSLLGITHFSATESAAAGQYRRTLPVASLPAGMYYVEITDGKRRWVEQVLKQ
jgi:hypothetical protein